MKTVKTNALRLLEQAKIPYELRTYEVEEGQYDGMLIVPKIGLLPHQVFKTLVLKGERNGYLVCCLPVDRELDLKKVAAVFHDKKVEMLPMKDLLPLTGYVRGGCSPVGMKKQFPTFFDASITSQSLVSFSAGQRGMQMLVNPEQVKEYIHATVADLTAE